MVLNDVLLLFSAVASGSFIALLVDISGIQLLRHKQYEEPLH